ncbi:hypothetical protein SDA97_05340 [Legionella pneumophila serogroup 1]|uniref:hypothetical protein n=1 Tax=Legionella pneumophila TaxID=446 RepID=UPI000694C77F|nr:hypothetical protein [Legionella pneumophila]AMV12876.1 hypothetical protein ULM_01740 [Legionella pneumophila]MCW8466102.1 hypothetical protein [Legionella pneumophila]MCW8475736.1 hypothetical protein [Legionella pneumophila]MCZ4703289.1 hypothetical protein [Legionella pneumophila]CZH73695.1 Uncharacterised protein [Legionella pneumophila]
MSKLSKDEGEKLVLYLKEKWKGKSCPMCQTGNWIVQGNCFQLTEYNANAFVIGGPVIPIIPVICNNCSNTLLINALLAHVVAPNDKTPLEQGQEELSEKNKDA